MINDVQNGGSSDEQLHLVEAALERVYGRPDWRPHGDPLDELIATVLSQHTSDANTDRAFRSLRTQFPTWRDVVDAPTAEIANAIRCGGLAEIKAPRIQGILRAIDSDFGELVLTPLCAMPLAVAKRWLQGLPGVGPKTAACVLLFSLGLPTMPVDTHVHRVSGRLGLIPPGTNADAAHSALDARIGPDRDRMYALHMNLIRHGRTTCRPTYPDCDRCALAKLCPSANSRPASVAIEARQPGC